MKTLQEYVEQIGEVEPIYETEKIGQSEHTATGYRMADPESRARNIEVLGKHCTQISHKKNAGSAVCAKTKVAGFHAHLESQGFKRSEVPGSETVKHTKGDATITTFPGSAGSSILFHHKDTQ